VGIVTAQASIAAGNGSMDVFVLIDFVDYIMTFGAESVSLGYQFNFSARAEVDMAGVAAFFLKGGVLMAVYQLGLIGRVRVVAIAALRLLQYVSAVGGNDLLLGRIVALLTEFADRHGQVVLIIRSVRQMARGTFTIGHRLMHNCLFQFLDFFCMAGKT